MRALSRVRSSNAQIVLLFAPAGYGKSTLANALREDYPSAVTCDCSDVLTPASFTHAVLAALAAENVEHAAFYSELQMQVKAGDDQNQCSRILESAWQRRTTQSLFTFENAETLAHDGPAAGLLARLLHTVPLTRRILVCSRMRLGTRASRYLAPHRLLVIGTEQLSLDDEEATQLLRNQNVPECDWPQIIDTSKGWPILLLLLTRLSLEGRLAHINNHSAIVLDELFSYLLHEVLDPLEPQTILALALCAAVPDLSTSELSQALQTSEIGIRSLLRSAPLVQQRNSDRYTVHSLMKEPLHERAPDWKPYLARIARAAQDRAEHGRAAFLFRITGDLEAAAHALELAPVDELLSSRYAAELANIPSAAMRKHPKLTLAVFNKIGFTPSLRSLLVDIFNHLKEDEDPALAANLARAIVSANWWLGDVESNRQLLSSSTLQRALDSDSALAREAFLGVAQCFDAGLGAVESNIEPMRQAYQTSLHAMLPHPSTLLARKIAASERWRGQKEASIQWCEDAIGHARDSGSALLYSSLLIDALMNAWFWGDGELVSHYESELDTWSAQSGFGSQFSSLRAAFAGEADPKLLPLPAPNVVFAQLIAAASTTDSQQAASRIAQARALAEATEELPLIALCRIAQAVSTAPRRVDAFAEALAALDSAELPALHQATLACREGRPSFLDAFIAQFSQETQAPDRNDIAIEILNERVRIGQRYLSLSAREVMLVAFLCRHRTSPREEIQDALWPHLDERSARDSLYSLLYRIRKRAEDTAIIENCGNAYRLAPDVSVDLWSIQAIVRDVERGGSISLAQVQRWHAAIQHRSYPHLLGAEWFAATDYQIHEQYRVLARHLINEALERSDYAAALTNSEALIEEDDLDDWAHEVVIRVYIESGNASQALRAYRRYRSILEQNLDASPSPEIESLTHRHGLLLGAAAGSS